MVHHADCGRRSCISHDIRVKPANGIRQASIMANGQTSSIGGANLRRSGLRGLGAGAKVSVDMMGIGGMSCAHWQSTQALRSEGTIWIYGFWTGLNYVAAASGQTETKVDTAAVMVEVKKTCAQRPSQVLASAVWTAYPDLNKR
jgi:hypothetical protein